MRYFKFLKDDGVPIYGQGQWKLPTEDGPGEWMPVIYRPSACYRGYHACQDNDGSILYWTSATHLPLHLFEVEFAGKVQKDCNKVVGGKARLLREFPMSKSQYDQILIKFFREYQENSTYNSLLTPYGKAFNRYEEGDSSLLDELVATKHMWGHAPYLVKYLAKKVSHPANYRINMFDDISRHNILSQRKKWAIVKKELGI